MSEVLVIEFSAPDGGEIYAKVNEALGWKGPEDRPAGLISHITGTSGNRLMVVEAWESKAAHDRFMQAELGPAFAKAAVPEPARIEWLTQLGGDA